MLTAAPPSTDSVPVSKSTSIRDTRLPLGSVTAKVVSPVKFSDVARQKSGVAAGQRGGRREGGIGIVLGVEGKRRLLRKIAQLLLQIAKRAVAHLDQAAISPEPRSGLIAWLAPIGNPVSGLMFCIMTGRRSRSKRRRR